MYVLSCFPLQMFSTIPRVALFFQLVLRFRRKLKQALLTIRSPAVLITFAQFYAWNPAVGSNCESLWASEAYCVGIPGSKSTTSITTSTTSTSNIVPGPTQTGIISTCNKYYLTPASGKHSRESSNLTETKASIYRLIMRRNRVTVYHYLRAVSRLEPSCRK
jgi:hypothetical protein